MIARLRQFLERLLASFRGSQLDEDLNAEMASHLDFAVEENLQRGMSAEEARRQAVDRMVTNATAMGANAVVMMRFDSSEIGQTMSEIVAYGTAATIEPLP